MKQYELGEKIIFFSLKKKKRNGPRRWVAQGRVSSSILVSFGFLFPNVPRIDSFIINLMLDYISKFTSHANAIIKNIANLNACDIHLLLESSYILPQIFTNLDTQGLIQKHANISLLCHWKRNKAKTITIWIDDFIMNLYFLKCSPAIPNINFYDIHCLDTKKC